MSAIYWFLYILAFFPLNILCPIKIYGKKRIPKHKQYILICNHQSNWDAIIVNRYFHKRFAFLTKKELATNKSKKFFLEKILNCILVDRQNFALSTTKQILKTLSDGKSSLAIFPQGTRKLNESDENLQIKNGICMFAIKSKKPVLPIFIEKKQRIFRRNKIYIGEPFELSEFYDKKLTKEVFEEAGEIVTAKMLELSEISKNNYKK